MEQVKVQKSFEKSWKNVKYSGVLKLIADGKPVVALREQDAGDKRSANTVTAKEWVEMRNTWELLNTPEFSNYVTCPGCGGNLYVVGKRKNAAAYWVHNPRQEGTKTCTYSWKVPDKEFTPKVWLEGMKHAVRLNGGASPSVFSLDEPLKLVQDPLSPHIESAGVYMIINGEPVFNQDGYTKVNAGIYKDLFSEDFNNMNIPKTAYIHLRGRTWTRHTDNKDGLWRQVFVHGLEPAFSKWCAQRGYMYFTKLSSKGMAHWNRTRGSAEEVAAESPKEDTVKPYTSDLPVIPEFISRSVIKSKVLIDPQAVEPEPDRVAVLCANTLYVGRDVTQFRGQYAVKLFNGGLAIISKDDVQTAHRIYCSEGISKDYERRYRGKMIIK